MAPRLTLLLPVAGLLAGAGAGYALRPSAGAGDPTAAEDHAGPAPAAASGHDAPAASGHEPSAATGHDAAATPGTHEYVRLANQFVVPVIGEDRVTSLVILSLSLEVDAGMTEAVYNREPKLRDVFLRVLFDHANAGGFDGFFTGPEALDALRRALREAASGVVPEGLHDVLILDIVRQDS